MPPNARYSLLSAEDVNPDLQPIDFSPCSKPPPGLNSPEFPGPSGIPPLPDRRRPSGPGRSSPRRCSATNLKKLRRLIARNRQPPARTWQYRSKTGRIKKPRRQSPTGLPARGWLLHELGNRAGNLERPRQSLPRADAAVLVWYERLRKEVRPAQCRCRNLPLQVAHASRRRMYPSKSLPSGSSDSDVHSTPSVASPCNGSRGRVPIA